MEDSWEYWLSHLGMGGHDGTTTTISAGSSLSFEDIISFKGQFYDDGSNNNNKSNNNNNNNNVEEKKDEKNKLKRGRVEKNEENEKSGTMKKGRSSSEAMDHIMSERKRRQEMAERFIALSATIPGLKKIDKASVLQEAINYVKQLQQRISELEQEETNDSMNKITKPLIVTKSHTSSCETNHDDDDEEVVVVAPEVEARKLEKEVLIRIHCEKRNGIMLKLLALLENNHLCVASSSILPFGNSALNIIIIAQMTEEFSLTVNDLVKTLKKHLMKFMRCNNN